MSSWPLWFRATCDELIDSDLATIEAELAQLTAVEAPTPPKKQPKRAPLPPKVINKGIPTAGLLTHRQKVPDGSGTARALDYSLKRWKALTRYLDDDAI